MSNHSEVVWLSELRIYAFRIRQLAHVSQVKYSRGGIGFEVWITNDEIESWEDRAIEYESE